MQTDRNPRVPSDPATCVCVTVALSLPDARLVCDELRVRQRAWTTAARASRNHERAFTGLPRAANYASLASQQEACAERVGEIAGTITRALSADPRFLA